MTSSENTIFQHDPNIVTRMIAGEMILVPIRKNVGDMESIYTLNETAAQIWSLIDGKNTLQQIAQQMANEFDVDVEQAEKDVLELVQGLQEFGALVD